MILKELFTAWKSFAVFQRVRFELVKSAEPPINSGMASQIRLSTVSDNFLYKLKIGKRKKKFFFLIYILIMYDRSGIYIYIYIYNNSFFLT